MSEAASRYLQAKLEIFGLHKALRHWRFYLVGLSSLTVEIDAKYVKGMINSVEEDPDPIVARWIQAILLYDFEFVHVPADKFRGPDALSRWPPYENYSDSGYGSGSEEDDSWLDQVALIIRQANCMGKSLVGKFQTAYEPLELPSCFLS